ncbi:Rrf2 family transcriptional regulator [bacterium]|nr:Rrf2 family transcriptional regulator [bacterium]
MITTTGEYALRAAVYLAQHLGQPRTTVQIAEGTLVPQGYLSKIMQQLVKAELAHSQRGLHGGFVLARDPSRVSVLEILAAVDSAPQRIRKCPLGLPGHVKLCPVHRLVDDSVAQVERAFAAADLHSLSQSARGIKPLCDVNKEGTPRHNENPTTETRRHGEKRGMG